MIVEINQQARRLPNVEECANILEQLANSGEE